MGAGGGGGGGGGGGAGAGEGVGRFIKSSIPPASRSSTNTAPAMIKPRPFQGRGGGFGGFGSGRAFFHSAQFCHRCSGRSRNALSIVARNSLLYPGSGFWLRIGTLSSSMRAMESSGARPVTT